MRHRTAGVVLALAAVVTLPGCVVSLFSSSTQSERTTERTEQLERRMDRVEETMRAR